MPERMPGDSDRDSIIEIQPEHIGSENGGTDIDTGVIRIEPEYTNPDTATGGDSSSGEPRKRRGRKPGSKNKTTTHSIGVEGVAAILVTIHSGLVIITKCPEMEITEEEATKLAKASVSVARLYDIEASQKALAWANLIGVAGSIYLTRIFAIQMRIKMQKEQANAKGNSAILPFPPTNLGPSMVPH